ncbi:MAG TPA: PDZ domain-containing protein, partial [Gemmatimonadaceae bacterium]|nr:PDZ domain-containing protein [Gemmatimonadaceae bacterium]
MRVFALLPTVFAGALATSVSAQMPGAVRIASAPTVYRKLEDPRAVIGVTTNAGATNRDTLGVLVSAVRDGSPAEKAGIQEGDRIASINGVSLKLAAADVGDYEMADAMSRRLSREIGKLHPGDEVDLRVVSGGQTKSVKVKTISSEDLRQAYIRRADDERATLGLQIATTGTSRDSIGVLVLGVDDNSPAAKAGIEEGSRIASINGVDLRASRTRNEDEGFYAFSSTNTGRLERELNKVKPGDDVELRLYFNGQYKNLKVKTVRASDLPRHGRTMVITRDDSYPSMMPLMGRVELQNEIPNVGRLLDQVGRGFARIGGGRVEW